MEYDLEIGRIVKEIKALTEVNAAERGKRANAKMKARTVLLQFPDGLKPKATGVAKELEKLTGADVMVWAGSNFGGCDIPKAKVDLIVNFGHAEFV